MARLENHTGKFPVRSSMGRGVIARLTNRMYFGNGYSLLIPVIKPMPPPPPIKAFPGRFKAITIIR